MATNKYMMGGNIAKDWHPIQGVALIPNHFMLQKPGKLNSAVVGCMAQGGFKCIPFTNNKVFIVIQALEVAQAQYGEAVKS